MILDFWYTLKRFRSTSCSCGYLIATNRTSGGFIGYGRGLPGVLNHNNSGEMHDAPWLSIADIGSCCLLTCELTICTWGWHILLQIRIQIGLVMERIFLEPWRKPSDMVAKNQRAYFELWDRWSCANSCDKWMTLLQTLECDSARVLSKRVQNIHGWPGDSVCSIHDIRRQPLSPIL